MSAVRLLIVCALVLVAPRVAEPCSCSPRATTISPADGSTNVPLNAIVIVQPSTGPLFVELRNASTNETVTMTIDIRGSKWGSPTAFFGRPIEPLLPNTMYVVTTGPDADNVTTAIFTTGNQMDESPSYFPGLRSLSFETMMYPIPDEDGSTCFSSCVEGANGLISRIVMDYPPLPDDTVYAFLQVRRADGGAPDLLPLRRFDDRVFGYDYCSVRSPPLEPGVEYCGLLIAYDVAGHGAIGSTAETCSIAATCTPWLKPSPFGACDPSDECVIEPPEEAPETGCGCSSTPSPGWLLFAAFALIFSRRRASRIAA